MSEIVCRGEERYYVESGAVEEVKLTGDFRNASRTRSLTSTICFYNRNVVEGCRGLWTSVRSPQDGQTVAQLFGV